MNIDDQLGAADENARAEWEDGEGAEVATSSGIWHAAIAYERNRVAQLAPVPPTGATPEMPTLRVFDSEGTELPPVVASTDYEAVMRERDEANRIAKSEFDRATYYEKEALAATSRAQAAEAELAKLRESRPAPAEDAVAKAAEECSAQIVGWMDSVVGWSHWSSDKARESFIARCAENFAAIIQRTCFPSSPPSIGASEAVRKAAEENPTFESLIYLKQQLEVANNVAAIRIDEAEGLAIGMGILEGKLKRAEDRVAELSAKLELEDDSPRIDASQRLTQPDSTPSSDTVMRLAASDIVAAIDNHYEKDGCRIVDRITAILTKHGLGVSEDTARLDWLDTKNISWLHSWFTEKYPAFKEVPLRAAIDAARQPSKE